MSRDRQLEDNRQLEDRLGRLRVPVDPSGVWDIIEERAQGEEQAPPECLPSTARADKQADEPAGIWKRTLAAKARTPRRPSSLRIVLYASLAVVIVAAVTVGTLEAFKHLGGGQPILVITDDTTGVSPGSTGQTAQSGDEQPSAAMVGGNAARTGVYPDGGPTDQPDLLWKFQTGDRESTSPVVSDGVVYVSGGYGADDQNDERYYLYALDARSGEEKWRFPCWSRGPAVSEGLVYTEGYDDYLYALDAETGQEIWKFQTGGSSPAVADGVVYIGSYALDAASGQLKWGWDYDAMASPAVSDAVVYFSGSSKDIYEFIYPTGSNGDYLYALDAQTGEEKWTVNPDDDTGPYSFPVVSDGVVYIANAHPFSTGDSLHAFDARTGEEKWVYKATGTGNIRSSPAVSGGVVYLLYEASDSRLEANTPYEANALLVALDAASGRELWQFGVANSVCCIEPWSSPSISGNVVYLHTCSLEVGRLHALDASTGEELWTSSLAPEMGWGVASSSPAISDGVVYVSGIDGYLYALK